MTRWLSQLYMIRHAIQLKTSLETLLIVAKEDWDRENRSKRTGTISKRRLDKLPRYLREHNQLCDRDRDVLQRLERLLTVFETVVKTLEGDGQLRVRRHGQSVLRQSMYGMLSLVLN
jgi:hypothetical protein